MAGLDDRRYPNAWEVDFRRLDAQQHNSFGAGAHRCPGSLLAKLEIRVFLQEWLARIPEFQVKPGRPVVYGPGQVNCVDRLELEWQP
jgi:cytochrome P450